MQTKLTHLAAKSAEKGHWALVAAITNALKEDDVDSHINVLGGIHEVGLLKNSSAPFAKIWRDTNCATFAAACVKRLMAGDADYWAVAALLGADIVQVAPAFIEAGFELLAVNRIPAFKDPELHVASLALRDAATPKTLAPLVELGWNTKTGELYDVSRWRAVILTSVQGAAPNLHGKGFGSYFLRAKLPYGCWRVLHDDFNLDAQSAVPLDQTLWPTAHR